METIVGAAVGAGAAILTQLIVLRGARAAHLRDLEKEFERHRLEVVRARERRQRRDFDRAHVLLSGLARDCSLTSMTMNWEAGLTTAQWDEKYREMCRRSDELRMLATRFGSEVTQAAEELYGQMNVYWGSYRGFLHRLAQGDAIERPTPDYQRAHEAADRIGALAAAAKEALRAKDAPRPGDGANGSGQR
jgi:hypothetical protein